MNLVVLSFVLFPYCSERRLSVGWVTDIDTLDSMLVRFYYVLLFPGKPFGHTYTDPAGSGDYRMVFDSANI